MKKPLSIVLGLALVAVLVGLPGPAAVAAPQASVIIQLVTPAKKALPLAKAYVSVTSADFSFAAGKSTNSSGRVRISVPAGIPLEITATHDGYTEGKRAVGSATAGATSTLRVALPRGASISGTLRNASAKALRGATVTLFTKSGNWVDSDVTSASGVYRINGLASGSYRVQFNSRVADPPRQAVIANYTWNYWKKASWSSATAVVVTQQTAKTKATVTKRINGTVPKGSSITGDINMPGLSGGAVVGLEAANFVDSVSGRLNTAGTSFSVKAVKGKYRVYVWGDDDSDDIWWYTGDNTAPSHDENDARTVSFSGTSDLTLRFDR